MADPTDERKAAREWREKNLALESFNQVQGYLGQHTAPWSDETVAAYARTVSDPLREQAVDACLDMANRYDFDIEGCDGDELLRYGEGITCCFRLAYIIKYGTMPPKGDAWQTEFTARAAALTKE
jgi:hypothetical protein